MRALNGLKPEKVFEYFEEISAIPRGSGNTKAVSDYCVNFAKERGLWVHQDEYDNVIIKKPASAGYESAGAVILQGHLDMVCLAADGFDVDFEKDGVKLYTEDGYVKARGTTLGADDGIAVAMTLAILDDDTLPHPAIEAVFTTDEEVGLTGAENLDASPLEAKTLINIDSEEEGIITVSCAGGARMLAVIPLTECDFDGEFYKISVGGMLGGHSGIDIDKRRANANKVIARVLRAVNGKTDMRIADICGGLRENAIANNAYAVIAVNNSDRLLKITEMEEKALRDEYRETDGGIFIRCEKTDRRVTFDKKSTDSILGVINESPDGIQSMSENIDGLVQTSTNLGTVRVKGGKLESAYFIRSSSDAEKQELMDTIIAVNEKYGARVDISGVYSGWEYKESSALRDIAVKTYKSMYKKEPQIAAIHAGLECGIFAGKIDGLDAISIGPDMIDVHTPMERLNIGSVERVYNYVLALLKSIR